MGRPNILQRYLMVLIAGLALAGPAVADEYMGLVNSVQYSYFTIMQGQNKIARILLKPGTVMHPSVRSGVKIRLIAYENPVSHELILEEIEEVSNGLLRAPEEPGINVPFTDGKVYVPIP